MHISLQLLFIHTFGFVVCWLVNLINYSLPVEITKESSVLIHNCGVVLGTACEHLKFVKEPKSRKSKDSALLERVPGESEVLLEETDYAKMHEKQAAMRDAEHVILRQLETVRLMLKDLSEEPGLSAEFQGSLCATYDVLEEVVQLCMAIRLAVEDGFIHRLAIKILRPLRAKLEELHRNLDDAAERCSRAAVSSLKIDQPLSPLLVDPDDLLIRPRWDADFKHTQKALIKHYETVIRKMEAKGHLVASPSEEVTRMNFVMHSLFSSRKLFRKLNDRLSGVSEAAVRDSNWLPLQSRFNLLKQPLMDFLNRGRWFVLALASLCRRRRPHEMEEESPISSTLNGWRQRQGWSFPLRLALSAAISTSICVLIDTYSSFDLRTLWISATTIFVSSPTVGGSIRKGLHRLVGTTIAAIVGQLLRFGVAAVALQSIPWATVLLIVVALVFVAITTYTQHSSKYPKPYQCATTRPSVFFHC